jgi:hypothetical protein
MNIINRILGPKKQLQSEKESIDEIPGIRTVIAPDMEMLTVDLDSIDPESRNGLKEEVARINKLPLFTGKVEYGFSMRFVETTDRCPKCGAITQRFNANFVYVTDIAPRVMLVPAGFFCSSCPTVIIDEDLISTGIKQGFRFRRVVGIDHGKDHLDLFTTWNGEKTIYVLDENQQLMDMITENESCKQSAPAFRRSNSEKARRRQKAERKARKRNRRK